MTLNQLITIRGLEDGPMFRIRELCALFGVSRQTIYRWLEDGRLAEVRVTGRVRWITRASVAALVEGAAHV